MSHAHPLYSLFPWTVPSAPLSISMASVSTSSNEIAIAWTPPAQTNGIITAYTVYCNTSATQAFPEQVIGPNMASIRSIVNGTSQLAIFNTGLNPYTQYECFVTATTSAGEGVASPILIVRTRQSGENFTNFFIIVILIY